MLPAIQSKNLNVAIPSVERMIGGVMNPDLSSFFAMLYQHGGVLYDDKHTKVLLDEQKAVEAFEMYTKFFTHYKTPRSYDFANRFRSGEIPLGMADYNTYNTLAVFAPEIRGLWKFGLVPGTRQENDTIDHSTGCWGQCSMMLSSVKDPDRAWKFLKWWADPDTQVRFGRELEAVMGDAARYATANKTAFPKLGWKSEDRDTLMAQWKWVKCNPEVPGGYYTSRHITKLDNLEDVCKRIFRVVEDHPEKLPEIRKFMEYYMPTTLKLVHTYREFEDQKLEGDNITRTKKDIEDTLDMINVAFENLLNDLFKDAAVEASADISVLNALFAQEGLKEKEFEVIPRK